ncbi:hypothetical protein F4778DRAFT_357244 [Xylariomycetidae sp. FL2044]|nr:hypothetical protein F4778DRAFT_357244 [Xylariomycetidae sp. FL2044]
MLISPTYSKFEKHENHQFTVTDEEQCRSVDASGVDNSKGGIYITRDDISPSRSHHIPVAIAISSSVIQFAIDHIQAQHLSDIHPCVNRFIQDIILPESLHLSLKICLVLLYWGAIVQLSYIPRWTERYTTPICIFVVGLAWFAATFNGTNISVLLADYLPPAINVSILACCLVEFRSPPGP